MSQPFDFDIALKALQELQAMTGKDGILTPLNKQLTETALAAELDSHTFDMPFKGYPHKKTDVHQCDLLNCPDFRIQRSVPSNWSGRNQLFGVQENCSCYYIN